MTRAIVRVAAANSPRGMAVGKVIALADRGLIPLSPRWHLHRYLGEHAGEKTGKRTGDHDCLPSRFSPPVMGDYLALDLALGVSRRDSQLPGSGAIGE